jgi:hypothetical protein
MDAGIATHEARPIKWPAMPYKGLNYFRESDAPLFTERDRDIRDCGMLLGQFSTRILLLHGNSGSGKSSFLRAGLVPWLRQQHGAFYFLADESGETIFVRSTDDPIFQIHEVLRAALDCDQQLSKLSTNELKAAKEELAQPLIKDRDLLAKRVVNALSAIAFSLTPTLVLMIDQSEEVFSTGTPNDEDKRRAAFFSLLEELCYQKLPLKVIVVMRTEFYGRFSNALGILPRTNVENSDIGFRQYLLRDLQTKESLVAVITRPTLDDLERDPNPPRGVYHFAFAKGVPELLANDLLEQFGETCPLPVLQIVCETLYRNVVIGAKRSEITAADYTSVGRAQGFMDKYVDTAIADVLSADERANLRDAVVSWRHVLASLAGRQGSGSVTTLIATEQVLVQTAEGQGLSGDIPGTLARMTERRLLRRVTTPTRGDEDEPKYSLGHDALAASLCIWSEVWHAYEGQRSAAEKQQKRRRKIVEAIALGFFCIAALAVVFAGFVYFNNQNAMLRRTTASIQASTESTFDNKLLGLLAALDSTTALLPNHAEAEAQLRKVLWRSPRYGGTDTAANFDLSSRRLAFLSADGIVSVNDVRGTVGLVRYGKIPDRAAASTFPSAAIGFVNGLDQPVVYRNGFLNAKIRWHPWVTPIELAPLLPPDFKTNASPFVEIAGGSIRVVSSSARQKAFNLLLMGAVQEGETVSFPGLGAMSVDRTEGRYLPTFSDGSNLMARLVLDENVDSETLLQVADLRDAAPHWHAVASMTPLNQQTGLTFARSITFAPGGKLLVMRREQNELAFYPVDAFSSSPPPTIGLEKWPSSMPPQRPNLRPLLAAAERTSGDQGASKVWRVAWPTPSGIVIGEGFYGGTLKPLLRDNTTDNATNKAADNATALYSNAIEVVRLRFSEDATLLVAESRGFREQRATVLVWDLSPERLSEINGLGLDALKAEACRVAGIVGSAQLGEEDMYALFGQTVNQPCPPS